MPTNERIYSYLINMAYVFGPIAIAVPSAVAFKIYMKLTTRWNRCYTCLVGETVIVTGANTGIGYYTALDFAKRGARVILACRNKDRAETALKKIVEISGNQNVVYKLVDMASLQSVRDFAKDINSNEDRLDILVNNAGIGTQTEDYTKDGIQTILQVNHIAGFLLTHLLIDKLKKTGGARVVNVASVVAALASLTPAKINRINKALSPTIFLSDMYYNSKLCNILCTIELAKRLRGTSVTVNALHPGVISTDFFREMPRYVQVCVKIMGSLFLLTPEEGAQTQIYVAVSKDVANISGGLFSNCRNIQIYRKARNPDLIQKVWTVSEDLAKLSDTEKIK
ncbi:dehydrogenase [Oryctes borbonicus]|uniref:Dehydrogenase n=1 Tax=Oryctes borbonicus TaxID=1629725 RepID=A0A0T6AT98_9SCAR|nr:dehydrogenase [Oryctes borbonicus]